MYSVAGFHIRYRSFNFPLASAVLCVSVAFVLISKRVYGNVVCVS